MNKRACAPILLSSILGFGVLVALGLFYWRSRKMPERVEVTSEPAAPMATYRHEYFLADYPEGWHYTGTQTIITFSEEADSRAATAPIFEIELVPVNTDSEPDLKEAIKRVVLPSDTIRGEGDRGKYGYDILLERHDPQGQQAVKVYAVVEWNAFYSHLAYLTGSAPRDRFSEVYPLFQDMHSKLSYLPPWPEQPYSTATVERSLYSFECPVGWIGEIVQRKDDSEIGKWWCVSFNVFRLDEDDSIPDRTSPKTIQEFSMKYGMDRENEILHHGPVTIDGRQAYEVVAEYYHGGYRRQFRSWSTVVKDNNTLHTFDILALIPVSEWETAEPVFRTMRDSFKFK